MKERIMEDLKLVQIFLSQSPSPTPGIYEVNLIQGGDFICTCPGYTGKTNCMHVRFVKRRVKENNGTYPLEISVKCSSEDKNRATESPEAFRNFVIKFGKIETC